MSRVLRELKKGELTLKDMSSLREGDAAKVQAEKPNAILCDYSLQHVVSMHWGKDLAEPHRDLRPFQLRIDDKKFLLSWGELKDIEYQGFFRREYPAPKQFRLQYYDGRKIMLDTGLNDDAQRDMIFRLYGDGFEVFLDWYQILRAGRFI